MLYPFYLDYSGNIGAEVDALRSEVGELKAQQEEIIMFVSNIQQTCSCLYKTFLISLELPMYCC